MSRDFKKLLNEMAGLAIGNMTDELYEMQDQLTKKAAKRTKLALDDLTDDDTKQPYELVYSIGAENELTGGNDDEYDSGLDEDIEPDDGFDDDVEDYDYTESSEADMLDAIKSSVENDNDVVIELDDGTDVYLSNSEAVRLISVKSPDDFYDALEDINTFTAFISDTYDGDALDLSESKVSSKHNRKVGKIKIVNRIRAGKLQIRKRRTNTKGYKVVGSGVVKMDPREIRKRKIGARIGKRKRKAKMGVAIRRRKISNRIRKNRLKG